MLKSKRTIMAFCSSLLLITPLYSSTPDPTTATQQTAQYFATLKNNPVALEKFLKQMPKGGDLHNHLAGAVYAENLLRYGANDDFCIDSKTHTASDKVGCEIANKIGNVPKNPIFYNSVVDAWSMRNFVPGKETGHDHFFATFLKNYDVFVKHSGQALTEIVNRAADQNVKYLELMVTPDNNDSGELGKKFTWTDNFAQMRKQLLANGLDKTIQTTITTTNNDEATLKQQLNCGTADAKPGCKVTVRYLYQVLREQAPSAVFAQLLSGFEVANRDPRFVGINMVQAEDGPISMRDYKLQMQMVNYLHSMYPKVNISLHAGELAPGLVPPQGLTSHIRDAIEIAHAQRIGHGVDVLHETNSKQLLKEMAAKQIMVEINLTSNDSILGIAGRNHPLIAYMTANVPVALSTDDEGVLRTNLTHEYQRAVTSYQLSYPQLKNIDRNSLTYSFLPGKSLWADPRNFTVTTACKADKLGAIKPSTSCQDFLNTNQKAALQWQLENDFANFEQNIELAQK